jgi:hypothetical protein
MPFLTSAIRIRPYDVFQFRITSEITGSFPKLIRFLARGISRAQALYLYSRAQHRKKNIQTVNGIRTHDLSDQVIEAYASDSAATGPGFMICTYHKTLFIIIVSGSTVLVRTLAASHRRSRNRIKTLGRTSLDERLVCDKGLYLHRTTKHRNTRTNIHASSGIRAHDSTNQEAKTYALDNAATGTGIKSCWDDQI